MTTNLSRGSATIINFPARGRYAAGEQRDGSSRSADFTAPRVLGDVFGSGWYHEAAIQESKRAGEH